MKILIGTSEIANWIEIFKNEFTKAGHEVTTVVDKKHPFYKNEYNYLLNVENEKYRFKKKINSNQIFLRFIRKIQNAFADLRYKRFIFRLIDRHDVILKMWHPLLNNSEENSYIKKRGKKLIQLFVGSDIRYFNSFSQEYNVSQWTFPSDFKNTSLDFHLGLIRKAEKYADLIYSTPDQAGLQLKPYHHLQVPVSTDNIKFINHSRIIPKVLHAPSIPFKKGTDIIEATLQKLKSEGIRFEFKSIRDLPHHEVLELLTDSDVLIDEIVFNGPGALSFESMLAGCAVATRYIKESPECFQPPVWPIDAENIYRQLKILLTDIELRNRLITSAREYVLKNNEAKIVVKNMLEKLGEDTPFDYYPTFLRDRYIPETTEIPLINKWTQYVKNCKWYKKNIIPGERNSLIF